MSRIGKQPIALPAGVSVTADNQMVSVSGPKGNLTQSSLPGIKIASQADQVLVTRDSDEPSTRAKHGLMRALINNMVLGVSQGYEKKLEISGVGYRVQQVGSELKFALGFSHEVTYKIPEGVNVTLEQNFITLSSPDKQQIGQVAAEIRSLKKPEPYKGKGIKFVDERIIRKSGSGQSPNNY
ncbi:MAG: 50S ribosomal protein L6 [Candidatus Saccharibacteria bacterium GW2011_GWA2_46_10]|nr:MAG: 50S ribosomal protein L6 [Candidatus Saccharibacteria bacterium GW2011_GWA2_46_10]